VTFLRWLKQQSDRSDVVGDLARDVLADKCLKYVRTAEGLRAHIRSHSCEISGALRALDKAVREFGASKAPISRGG